MIYTLSKTPRSIVILKTEEKKDFPYFTIIMIFLNDFNVGQELSSEGVGRLMLSILTFCPHQPADAQLGFCSSSQSMISQSNKMIHRVTQSTCSCG